MTDREHSRHIAGWAALVALLVVGVAVSVELWAEEGEIQSRWAREEGTSVVLRGHTDEVTAVAFSPDGKRAMSGSRDNTVRLWEVSTGKCTQTFTGHTGPITTIAFSPDGRSALTGSADHTVRLWKLPLPIARHPRGPMDAATKAVCINPECKTVFQITNEQWGEAVMQLDERNPAALRAMNPLRLMCPECNHPKYTLLKTMACPQCGDMFVPSHVLYAANKACGFPEAATGRDANGSVQVICPKCNVDVNAYWMKNKGKSRR